MNLNLKFGVLSALLLLMTCTRLRGSGSSIFGKVAFTAVLSVSNLNEAQGVTSFFHRMGPLAGGPREDESDEEENESQARVEPQITSLNRDECLAKLLCGMSVPVTGTGAPKEGYYSEYANIVARFFEAFPLDDDEKGLDSSPESIEAYDDYSLEDTKPTRINSKKRKPDGKGPSKSSTGLQLIDLALIKTSDSANKTQQTEDDDERTGRERFINKRESRARKIVAKLGEKLQTVRQCQQISGCPFTFKQLRSRLKSRPSITSNVPLGDASSVPSINYNYKQPGVSGANRPSSYHQQKPSNSPTHPHNGDDEIEQFYGSPPIVIKRPPGFGINQVSASNNQQQAEQYAPYDPHTKTTPTLQPSHPMFPKKKVNYQIDAFKKRPSSGENDEFDDVNKSTGPVTLVGGDEAQQGPSKNNEANNNDGHDGQKGNDDDNNDSDEYYDEGEGDGDNEDYYNDGDDSEEGDNGEDDESGEGDEEEEEDTSGEGESETKKKTQNGQNKKKKKQPGGNEKENDTQPGGGKTKPKVVNYKKPSSPSSALIIEEEFEKKKPGYDDELEHPDNVWSKYSFAASGGLLKEPKDRVKTPLEEKNDEKLNVSSSSEKSNEKKESAEDSSEEEDEEDQEDARSTRRRPTKDQLKVSIDDDEEFEATKDFMKKYKPKRRANPKYGGDHGASGKRRKASEANEKSIEDKKEKDEEKDESGSEEEDVGSKKGQIETIITHIGGRPIVPPPEAKKNQKKVGGLGRFKFNLVRPYGGGGGDESDDEDTQLTPSLTSYSRKRTVLPPTEYKPSLPSYVRPTTPPKPKKSSSSSKDYLPSYSKKSESKKPSSHSHGSSSLHQDSASQSEGYMPKVSFGSSNGGKLGTVEYLGAQSAQAQAKQPSSMLTFPFSNPLTSLTSLIFQRPGSSGANQDIPGGQNSAPVAAFVHRPVGPESSKFRRIATESKKGKGGKKGKKSGSKKYKNKRRH